MGLVKPYSLTYILSLTEMNAITENDVPLLWQSSLTTVIPESSPLMSCCHMGLAIVSNSFFALEGGLETD